MKSDLDSLMKHHNLEALLITGPAQHNPAMYYMTGGAHLTSADLIKKRGAAPVLFYNSMEREEAAGTGLQTKNLGDYNFKELLAAADGDYVQAAAKRYQRMLEEHGVSSGRLAIYGKIDAGAAFTLFSRLQRLMPKVEIVGELDDTVLLRAMATKDKHEAERIRKMGNITTTVVGRVADFLSSQRAKEDVLVKSDGSPVTIGEVKRLINLWLAELGAENPEGTIFAQGRDAGIPHSTGNPSAALRLGQTIVFDIFPCEAGGGYFYDFTRTWCLGYAPDEVQAVYNDVLSVFKQIMGELKAGTECQPYQKRTCDLFEALGHATIESNPRTEEGYVHSLGHGLGLQVHERPMFGRLATSEDRLDPGVVVTIEPGLYYPERGLGVRLEDTVYVTPNGEVETMAEYPLDLVLPVKSS